MTVTPIDIGFQFLSPSLPIIRYVCMSDVKTNSQSCFENEWLRAKIFTPATFPVFLGAFTKTNETISVYVCTHTTPATNGNLRELCLITVPTEFCSWSLNYKLITLQWRRKILLMIKISAIRLNKDDNLPEYNDECLLQAMFVPKQFSFVKRERSFIELYLFTSYSLSQKSALFSSILIVLEY